MSTLLLFRDDPYLRQAEATVVGLTAEGGVVLDRTVFYAAGGGQPGDSGRLAWDGGEIAVTTAVYGDGRAVVHVVGSDAVTPPVGATVTAALDWERRYRHMRVHTALHLLSVALPFPVTGGQIGDGEGRLDFDIPDSPDKAAVEAAIAAMVAADHAVSTEWITDAELEANPGLVKTMSVKPPMGSGTVRLVRIGDIDLQPCGGTHVASTAEVGRVAVARIEKKGRINRRVRIVLDAA